MSRLLCHTVAIISRHRYRVVYALSIFHDLVPRDQGMNYTRYTLSSFSLLCADLYSITLDTHFINLFTSVAVTVRRRPLPLMKIIVADDLHCVILQACTFRYYSILCLLLSIENLEIVLYPFHMIGCFFSYILYF